MRGLYVRDVQFSDKILPIEALQESDIENLRDTTLLCLCLELSTQEAAALLESRALHEIILSPFEELADRFNKVRARKLLLYLELAKRVCKKGLSIRPTISCPAEALPFLTEIREKSKEHFLCLYLNARHQVIHNEIISIGTLSASIVHPREVYVPAISHKAACVLLAHNHPSGDPAPSREDIELTRRLVQAGEIIGIEVVDHIIISPSDFVSLKEQGVL
jgi:DNA repair protein RadC